MPKPDAVVLDTHVLLWWLADDRPLGRNAKRAITDARTLVISAITFWEVGMLLDKGRVQLDRPLRRWTQDVLAADRVTCDPLSAQLAARAAQLVDLHGDPADRMIAATAIEREAPLITKDDRIRSWARSGAVATIW